jgi:antitoxin component YwqK of YwqJK toxin-antitoxin module
MHIICSGKSYNSNGSLFYDGEHSNGKHHGKGIMYKNNLIKFEGTFENSLRVGFFTITYKSGHIIKGIYKNDSLHGKITIILPSGKTFEGILKNSVIGENHFFTFTNEQTGKIFTSMPTKNEQSSVDNLFEQLEQDA